jgi:putative salt-induced outer membrane protein
VRSISLSLVFLVLTSFAAADQVVLKNGDRLTGSIIKSDTKSLVMKSQFAGEVTIDWSAVQQVTSDQQLHVATSNGQTAVGEVSSHDGELEVASATGPVVIPKDSVVLMRNDAEQSAYDQSLHPGLGQNWAAGANVGFALTRGNSQTKNLAVAFNADRKTLHDELKLYTNIVYSTNDAPGAVPSTTANSEQGGVRYDRNLTPRTFAFVGADFQADSLQTLNLRSILGGGIGFHVIRRENATFDLLAGGNYTRESYDPFSRSIGALTLGDEFTRKVGAHTVITQSLYFYPDLTNTGEYRGTFNFGTVTKISKWFGWQNSFGDIYVSDPPAGKKQNDLVFTTGLNITLIHPEGR